MLTGVHVEEVDFVSVSRLRESGVSAQRAGGRATSPSRWLRRRPPPGGPPATTTPAMFGWLFIIRNHSQFAFGLRPSGGRILKARALHSSPPFRNHINTLCCGAAFYNFFPPSTTLCMFLLRFLHPLFIYSTLLCLHLPVITFVVFSLALPPIPPSQALPYPGSL